MSEPSPSRRTKIYPILPDKPPAKRGASLVELDPQERKKIGKLIEKLESEKSRAEKIEACFAETQAAYDAKIQNLETHARDLLRQNETISRKNQKSIEKISKLKEQLEKIKKPSEVERREIGLQTDRQEILERPIVSRSTSPVPRDPLPAFKAKSREIEPPFARVSREKASVQTPLFETPAADFLLPALEVKEGETFKLLQRIKSGEDLPTPQPLVLAPPPYHQTYRSTAQDPYVTFQKPVDRTVEISKETFQLPPNHYNQKPLSPVQDNFPSFQSLNPSAQTAQPMKSYSPGQNDNLSTQIFNSPSNLNSPPFDPGLSTIPRPLSKPQEADLSPLDYMKKIVESQATEKQRIESKVAKISSSLQKLKSLKSPPLGSSLQVPDRAKNSPLLAQKLLEAAREASFSPEIQSRNPPAPSPNIKKPPRPVSSISTKWSELVQPDQSRPQRTSRKSESPKLDEESQEIIEILNESQAKIKRRAPFDQRLFDIIDDLEGTSLIKFL